MSYKKIRISKTMTRDRHRIVMENSVCRKLSSSELVHHKNENKDDDRLENLELTTRSDHTRHHMTGRIVSDATKDKLRNKPHYYGQDHPSSKLNNRNVVEIRKLLKNKIPERKIAKSFSVGKTTIHQIKTRETWSKIC
jgi:hypothetical protein